jgi:cold shock CspA family protein
MRVVGKVIRFTPENGYGWILPENSRKAIFLHSNDTLDKILPRVGDILEFDIETTPKGDRAVRAVLKETDKSQDESQGGAK